MDESQGAQQPFLQANTPQPQQQTNQLGGLTPTAQAQTKITRQQLMAGLHHLMAFQRQYSPILKSPILGKGNIRPKLFDAAATLMGEGVFTAPEVINGMKDLPDDPVEQKKWLEGKLTNAVMAEKKLVSDFIAQGPGQDTEGPDYGPDNHKEHMTGLMGNYKRG